MRHRLHRKQERELPRHHRSVRAPAVRGLAAEIGPSSPQLGDVLEFMRLLWAVDHALHQTSKKMESSLGITAQQRLVIRMIGRFPGIPAGHLARLLHIHPGTLTGIIRRIERRGLVTRRSDPSDGRRSLLGLTERGSVLDVETEGTVEAAVQRALEAASPDGLEQARQVLRAIAEQLQESKVTLPASS